MIGWKYIWLPLVGSKLEALAQAGQTLGELAFIDQILTALVWLVQRLWVSVQFFYGLTMISLYVVTYQSSPLVPLATFPSKSCHWEFSVGTNLPGCWGSALFPREKAPRGRPCTCSLCPGLIQKGS